MVKQKNKSIFKHVTPITEHIKQQQLLELGESGQINIDLFCKKVI